MANSVKTEPKSEVSSPNNSISSSVVAGRTPLSETVDAGGQAQLQKGQRHKSLTSPILSPQDIAQEILERSKRKHPQRRPEGGDVIFTMKLAQRLAKRVVRSKTAEVSINEVGTPPSKVQKTKDEQKNADLDARELLSILQDGAETHYLEMPKPKLGVKAPARLSRGPYKMENKLDPELEKKLALKQLMEFSRKRGRPRKMQESNNNEVSSGTAQSMKNETGKPSTRKRSKGENRELEMLLQDEGAINMLYAIEKGDSDTKVGLLPSKRRMKKALMKKAQEVKQAILGGASAASPSGINLRHRTSSSENKPRKLSVDSLDSEHSEQQENFTFASPAEASKIIRRHSSSSSYSSRSNSPRRMSIEQEKSPPIISKSLANSSDIQSNKIDSSPTVRTGVVHCSTPLPQPPISSDPLAFSNCNTDRMQLSPIPKQIKISEKTERLIEMKCKELKLQPEHSEMIKQLIQQNKNGLKERLQSEFATKLKAGISKQGQAVSSSEPHLMDSCSQPDEAKPIVSMEVSVDSSSSLGEVSSTEKPVQNVTVIDKNNKLTATTTVTCVNREVWKMVEEDWSTDDVEPVIETAAAVSNTVPSINKIEHKIMDLSSPASSSKLLIEDSFSLDTAENESYVRQLDSGRHMYKELQLRRIQSLVHVNIAPVSTYLPQAFNSQVLREMTTLLEELSQDSKCQAILLTCQGDIFCNGLDLPALLHQNLEIRKNVATEMATALKQFVCKLCMLRKPVIVGVSGAAVGLGVVVLAYCDLVVATHNSTFHTPYTHLGYVPEAAATLALPHAVGLKWTNKLLIGCTKMTAAEAHQCGLVTKLLPIENFNKELIASSLPIANQSSQSMETTKALLLHNLRSRIGSELSLEVSMLRQHWTSEECQARIRTWLTDHNNVYVS